MSKKILIIEDDKDIAQLLKHYLEKENFQTDIASTGTLGLKQALLNPSLIILDLMLPEMDGLEVCKELKRNPKTEEIPIIMLTAKGEETDKIVGLELGADDYITKPFSPKEVVARVKALLRRAEKHTSKEKVYTYGDLTLDTERHEVSFDTKSVELTAKEFALLENLLRHKGKVKSREALLNEVWGEDYYGTSRTVDVHIRKIREKIPQLSEDILTVKNLGYKLKEK